ncbi:MAG: GNAT family N-acetyltransferase [Bacteroidia bacterium]|nr:GNAT family N-acetyltransferase [Bacteroidia bacterium]
MLKKSFELKLRALSQEDCIAINKAFQTQGWNKPVSQYETYLELHEAGKRDIIIAEIDHEFAGYLTIQWQSDYPPFKEKAIPEVVDFNVLKKFQRRGIGSALMDEAEQRIALVSAYAGIGVGMTQDYGAAQVLYVQRNYVPDGRGLVCNHQPVTHGDEVTIDDSLVLYLIKKL